MNLKYQKENFNGEYDFRCRFHSGWQIRANLHEYTELLYCKEGRGNAVIDGKSVSLSRGQLLWIPPNTVHQYDFPQAHVVCAVFSNDFIPLFFKAQGGRYYRVAPIFVQELSSVLDTFYLLQREDACTVSGYLNLICAKVLKQAEFETERSADGILYQKVISYLSEHYAKEISLSELAKKFGYNEKYLSHALHQLTGIHFRKLLSYYRIECAKRLLEKKDGFSITEIALKSGFSAINTFHRSFREETGMTPLEYRRKRAK